jgi:MFS family permease
LAGSAYLGGAMLGALLFGWLTDRYGRKTLFFVTLALCLAATAATALSWNSWSFALFRAATGAGIGGEAAAVNSTIQELIPARMRGWTDLTINGSFGSEPRSVQPVRLCCSIPAPSTRPSAGASPI